MLVRSLLFILSLNAISNIVGIRGIKNIEKNFNYNHVQIDEYLFNKYVLNRFKIFIKDDTSDYLAIFSNSDLEKLAKEVSYLTFSIARDFKLDPFALLGLIEKESFYKPSAISPTGAVGLTQMTYWGIAEVMHQLGIVKDQADEKAIKVFRNYYKKVNYNLSNKYKLPDLNVFLQFDSSTWSDKDKGIKKMLLEQPALSIFFGAVFLKALVAKECQSLECLSNFISSRSGDLDGNVLSKSVYEKALIFYNGDTAPIKSCNGHSLPSNQLEVRYCYAKRVISSADSSLDFIENNFEEYLEIKGSLRNISKYSFLFY